MSKVPFFLTIDTEGDNMWDRPLTITSTNVEELYQFQNLCNKYRIKPIYLTNYEASINKIFQSFVKDYGSNLEIGMHLHAWNSPEIYKLTENDFRYQPYLHEYPESVIENKISYMMKSLEDIFQTSIISHRGGRYSISPFILETLVNYGIEVDCSVVPGFDWSTSMGNPNGKGGPDFRGYERNKYEIIKNLIELPVSTFNIPEWLNNLQPSNFVRRFVAKAFNYRNLTLRSKLNNLEELKKVTDWNLANGATHLEYILHSSELVTGKSNLIKTKADETVFYQNLEEFFKFLTDKNVVPMTFKEYVA